MGDISKHFSRHEFECKCGCGMNTVDTSLITILEQVREAFSYPIIITSGNRCPFHNKQINGSKSSMHMESKAADFIVKEYDARVIQSFLVHLYPDSYGIGRYDKFTHIDVRSSKVRWGNI